jgi:RNA polymerase sigma factor (sigma-70 family)
VTAESGDTSSTDLERLYRQTRLKILGYLLRRTAEPSDAADLLAETYLTAWRRIDSIPAGHEAHLWLYGVARRTLANFNRHQQVEHRLAQTLRSQVILELARHHAATDTRWTETITDSLSRLGATDREIIELSAYEELSPTEIATVLGTTPGSVRVRLHRIRKALRADLRGADSVQSQLVHQLPSSH